MAYSQEKIFAADSCFKQSLVAIAFIFSIFFFLVYPNSCMAVEQGWMEAQCARGKESLEKQDYANAAHFFRKAAEEGFAEAQFNLGMLYQDGLGVTRDYARAKFWLDKAAKQSYKEPAIPEGETQKQIKCDVLGVTGGMSQQQVAQLFGDFILSEGYRAKFTFADKQGLALELAFDGCGKVCFINLLDVGVSNPDATRQQILEKYGTPSRKLDNGRTWVYNCGLSVSLVGSILEINYSSKPCGFDEQQKMQGQSPTVF